MKVCPICNESFADQLNFCDVDGARLTREASAQERNKWWSLLGAGLLVGALVITAASIIFLPKARVSTPLVNSEPQPSAAPSNPQPAESVAAAVSGATVSAEPETGAPDAVVPEVKKRDKALANANVGETAPNPKAAALATEEADKKSSSSDINGAPPAPKKAEAPPSLRGVNDHQGSSDTGSRPQTSPDLKKDQKTPPAIAKSSEKDSTDRKKNEDKDKKKG